MEFIVGPAAHEAAPEPGPVVGLRNAPAAYRKTQTTAPAMLLQGDAGGLYFHERTYESFLATATRLLLRFYDENAGSAFWVDIKGADTAKVEPVKVDSVIGRANFETTIKPLLQTPACEFRIRVEGEPTQPFKKERYRGSCIKLNHKGIGYVYVAANWVDEPPGHSEHGHPSTVMVEAISFLFPEATRQLMRFTLVIRGEGSHDVDLRNGANAAVKARLQAILHRLTKANEDSADPLEVQIYDAAHPPIDVSDSFPSTMLC